MLQTLILGLAQTRPTRRFGFKSTSNRSAIFSALLNKQSNCSSLRFVLSNCIKVLASSKAEVSYVFHRNDVDTLQTFLKTREI
jgi:hypothetical protein